MSNKIRDTTREGSAVVWAHAMPARRALQNQIVSELTKPPSSRDWPGSAEPLNTALLLCAGILYGVPYYYGDEGAASMAPVPSLVGVGGKGEALDGFDCSGMIRWITDFSVRHNVIQTLKPPMKRRAIEIAGQYPRIPIAKAIPGDIWLYGDPVQHVMIQVSRHNLLGACGGTSSTKGQKPDAMVKLKPLDYWKSARRSYVVRPFVPNYPSPSRSGVRIDPKLQAQLTAQGKPPTASGTSHRIGGKTLSTGVMGAKVGGQFAGPWGAALGGALGAAAGFAQDNDIGLTDVRQFFGV